MVYYEVDLTINKSGKGTMSTIRQMAIRHLLHVVVYLAVIGAAASLAAFSATIDPRTQALIDSLSNAAAFDSVLTMIPSILAEAEARKDSALVARLLAARGRAEIMTGRLIEGIASFDTSIDVARSVRDTTTWMTALGSKSLALAWQGRYDECVELNRTRLKLARRTRDRASEAWARTGLGYIHLLRGSLDDSRAEYTIAIELFRAEKLRQAELTPLIGLGRVLNMLEDIDSAREVYTRVLVVARDIGDHVQEADAINNLGALEFMYGDMSLALKYFERAYQLRLAMGDPQGAITPATNVALGRNYLGQYSEAADILDRAAETCRKGNFRSLLGGVLVTLGGVRYHQRLFHASAELYRESLSIGEGLLKKDHDEAVLGLAQSLMETDSTHAAAEVLKKGLEAPLPASTARLQLVLSQCLRRLGRTDEALRYLLEIERRAAEAKDNPKLVGSAVELSACYRELGRSAEALDAFMMAVDRTERRRRFTESLAWREAQGGTRDLVDASGIVLEHPPEIPGTKKVEALFDVFQRLKARTLLDRITEPRRRVEPTSELADLPIATLPRLQREVLRPGELFLDFIVGYETCYLFAVTRDSCRVSMLPGLHSDLPERVDLFRRAIGKPPQPGGPAAGLDVMELQASLGMAILGEASDLVADASCLLVAPDLYFWGLPFGALVVAHDGERGTALFESKTIHYVPSATVLEWLRGKRRPLDTEPGPVSVLALVPSHGGKLAGVNREVKFLEQRYARVSVTEGEAARAVMDDTTASFEVVHVAAHIEVNNERPWHSGILLGEPSVQQAGERPTGRREPDDAHTSTAPASTGLVPSDVRRDPYLRAGDIADKRIRANIVVLSGCESALGQLIVGEGLSGLTSAFLGAGVPAMVATLWQVDDRVTADLMKEFYLSLDAGLPAAAALQEAQLEIRSRHRTRHPFYWAAFVVVGDGNVGVRLERNSATIATPVGLAVAGAMVLAGLMYWLRRKKTQKKSPGHVI
jgi:tetratricopeptide (TPR) repeat protein